MSENRGIRYQQLDFGHGFNAGENRQAEYEAIFPDEPEGETVLDLGCHVGYYPIQAAMDGALWSLGIEHNEIYANVGKNAIRELDLGSHCSIEVADLEEYEFETQAYDHVLCLNILHHLDSIDRVRLLITRCVETALKRAVFVISLPGETQPLVEGEYPGQWRIEERADGTPQVRLTPEFFVDRWPRSEILSYPSMVNKGRMVVEVRRG